MKTPEFVAVLLGTLALDFLLLGTILMVPPLVYHVLVIMLFAVPLVVAMQAPACHKWVTHQGARGNSWSALSRLVCGSSLLFLLLVAAKLYFEGREPTSLAELIALLYLTLSFLRFYGAGLLNIPVALVCLLKGDKVGRLASVCAILCSGAGLALLRNGKEIETLTEPGEVIFAVFLIALSFAYGLVWGGLLNWVAARFQASEDSSPN